VLDVGEDAVAVVADSWWQAKKALDTVEDRVGYRRRGQGHSATSRPCSRRAWKPTTPSSATAGDAKGRSLPRSDTVSADYSYPYQNHATMEPMNTTALWTEERCEAWVPTQNGESALQAVASAAGLFPEQCEVYKTILGGGFGRRGMHDFVTQAVQIAKQMPGTHVKLLWSREEDHAPRLLPPDHPRAHDRCLTTRAAWTHCTCAFPVSRSSPPAPAAGGGDQGPGGLPVHGAEGDHAAIYASRICSPITPCATRTCARASGAA
jgi:isoquinoline 1-oxidoreductase beta subunit